MTPPTCATCRWLEESHDALGRPIIWWCQRFPPVPSSDSCVGMFPIIETPTAIWCGEHQPKEAPRPGVIPAGRQTPIRSQAVQDTYGNDQPKEGE